jgi:hypothetical protein
MTDVPRVAATSKAPVSPKLARYFVPSAPGPPDAFLSWMELVGARHLAWSLVAISICGEVGVARAAHPRAEGVVVVPAPMGPHPASAHPCPRLKLAFGGFSIDNLDASPVRLTGLQLVVYPLSERWIRGGIAFEGGAGHAATNGNSISARYGLLGLSAGMQYPARVTPFVEGHLSGGILSGRVDGAVTVGETTLNGASGTTWLYGRGVSVGAEAYVSGRMYVSGSLGWMRATWGAPDVTAGLQNPQAPARLVDVTSDSLLWRVGLGI